MEHTNGHNLASTKAVPSLGEKRYMGVAECADYCGVSRHTIYRLVKDEQIPFIPYGRKKKFDRVKIDAWIADRTVEAKI